MVQASLACQLIFHGFVEVFDSMVTSSELSKSAVGLAGAHALRRNAKLLAQAVLR